MLAQGGHTRVGAGHLEGEAEAEVGVITGGEVHAVEAALLRGRGCWPWLYTGSHPPPDRGLAERRPGTR